MRDAGDIQFAPVQPKPPPETPDWLKDFGEWLRDLLEPLGRALGMSWPTIQYVLIGLGVLLALIVLWFLLAPLIERWRLRQKAAPEEEWTPDRDAAAALLADADRLAREGRYEEAVHLLLQRSVADIAAARPDWLLPASTAREIATFPKLPDRARAAFALIAERVERSLFALRALNETGLERSPKRLCPVRAGGLAGMSGNPFSLRSALLLVLGGAALFVALLAMIGAGMGASSANDGGGHGAGKGLNGFAGFARLTEAQGRVVNLSRTEKVTGPPGLLVLTPPTYAKGTDILRMFQQHRGIGPTLVVTPKWQAVPIPAAVRPMGAKEGWVQLAGTAPPQWQGFLDDVAVSIGPARGGSRWQAQGFSGELPDPGQVLTGAGQRLVPLVTNADGGILAAYLADGGHYPALEAMALERPAPTVQGQKPAPVDPRVRARPDRQLRAGKAGKRPADAASR